MKGIIEVSWKLALIIILTLVAFIIIYVFTTEFGDRFIQFFRDINEKGIQWLIDFFNSIVPR